MAYCMVCGNELKEGAQFCPVCGTSVGEAAPLREVIPESETAPAVVSDAPEAEPAGAPGAVKIMVLGIVSLALSVLEVTFIGGIIVGAIGLSNAKKLAAVVGPLTGKARTGQILAKVGLIIGIVSLVLTALVITVYLIWLIVMVIFSVNYNDRYSVFQTFASLFI